MANLQWRFCISAWEKFDYVQNKQCYKEIVDKGQDFIWIEMKKVEPLCTSTFVECAVINVILYYVDRVGLNTQYRAESGREDPVD